MDEFQEDKYNLRNVCKTAFRIVCPEHKAQKTNKEIILSSCLFKRYIPNM